MQKRCFRHCERSLIIPVLLIVLWSLVGHPYEIVSAHANFLGNMDGEIRGNVISIKITMPEARVLDDQELFSRYTQETLLFTNNEKPCTVEVVNFTTGDIASAVPTEILLSVICEDEIEHLSVHSEYFLSEGYVFAATFTKAGRSYSNIFNDTNTDATLTFPPNPISVEGKIAANITTAGQFIYQGILHILMGYDHILFILALMLGISKFWSLFKVITAFTIAHSVTLILSSLDIAIVSSSIVEPLIALSVVYVALEKYILLGMKKIFSHLSIETMSHRWKVALGFGLVHGLGFASVLREIHIPEGLFTTSLISFNVGVEIGQLIIIALALPVLYLIMKTRWQTYFLNGASVIIGITGIIWFISRVFFNIG